LGGAHAHDRLVLAAAAALGDQLVAPQAVDAPVAPRELRRAKPWLAASRTRRALERRAGSSIARHPSAPHLCAGRRSAKAGAEEAGRAVAIGPRLKEAGVGSGGQRRKARAEVIRQHARAPSQQSRHPLLVLARRDRAGGVDERAAIVERPRAAGEYPLLDRSEALDQLRRFAPASVGPRAEGAEIGAWRVHEDAIVATRDVGSGCVRLDHTDA